MGKEIIYNDRHLIVRGILKGSKANIMIQAIEGSSPGFEWFNNRWYGFNTK